MLPTTDRMGIRPDAPFYNPDAVRWWVSDRRRVVVLTFPSPDDAAAWDRDPSLGNVIELDVL